MSAENSAVDLVGAMQAIAGPTGNLDDLLPAVEKAIGDAYRNYSNTPDEVQAKLNTESGDFSIFKVGSDGELVPVPVGREFLRTAALAVRNTLAFRLREAERNATMEAGESRRGQLLDVLVQRQDSKGSWWVTAGETEAMLPMEEQMQGERLRLHQHLKVVIVEARMVGKTAVMVVSRTHPALVQRIFEEEVPEVAAHTVIIKEIAREPGNRCKVAVTTSDEKLDARGTCIGPKGVRQRAIVEQLGGEQVQVISWSEDPATLIAAALQPAKITSVVLDQETGTAKVEVSADELSSAIGKAGDNARLTAKLTGWRIDISSPTSTLDPPVDTSEQL